MKKPEIYHPKNKIRIVTAASLFDGHDAAINIMRRIIQASGAEVIHLGHDRSVLDVVNCAVQEDVQAIAMTSYQGGHMEYFKYMYDLLKEQGCGHIKIFGGGGGVILPNESEELHHYGITRIYSPDDGRSMGLQGMINDMLSKCDFPTGNPSSFLQENNEKNHDHEMDSDTILKKESILSLLKKKNFKVIAGLISCAENDHSTFEKLTKDFLPRPNLKMNGHSSPSPLGKDGVGPVVLGITGTGGAGK